MMKLMLEKVLILEATLLGITWINSNKIIKIRRLNLLIKIQICDYTYYLIIFIKLIFLIKKIFLI